MRILIVDADATTSCALKSRLEREQHQCTICGEADAAVRLANGSPYDLIVSEQRVPDGAAVSLVRRLREQGNQTPFVILSSEDSVDDRVEALEAGADDCLTKPFSYAELLARIRAVSRRSLLSATQTLTYQDLSLNVSRGGFRGGTFEEAVCRLRCFEPLLEIGQL